MKLTDQQPPYKCLVNWQFDARASKVTSSKLYASSGACLLSSWQNGGVFHVTPHLPYVLLIEINYLACIAASAHCKKKPNKSP